MKHPRKSPHAALQAAQNAAVEAQATLADPGLRRALERLQDHYTLAMRTSAPADRDGREAAYFMLRALDVLANDLATTVAGGELARRNYRHVVHNEEKLQ
jgi:hypothetical protein